MATPAAFVEGPVLQPTDLVPPSVPNAAGWRVHVYAHTHWDREWYRTHERFRMQMVGVVDRILRVLDSDPRFTTFVLDGQTIVLEDYLDVRPEEEPRVRRLVRAGRLEVGPWYVLPDEFLVSAESLVRNLLEGRRVAARFGDPLAVGYLPDPFGHVAQLPALLRGFGIDNAIFSRGMGDEFARTGSEFRWESPDGTDVLAIVQTSPYTNGYCNAELFGRGNSPRHAQPYEAAAELAPYLVDRARTDVLLFAAGCDHETVQPLLPDVVDQLAVQFPDADVRITGLDAVVVSVRDAERRLAAGGTHLERYAGELRGSRHAPILSSIFSARVPLKQQNDHVQMFLERHVEPLVAIAVAAGVRPARDVEPFLRRAWRLVLENHPHDSIGGCSIDRVHLEMPARTLRAVSICHGLVEDLRIALDLGAAAVVHDAMGIGGIAERADGTPVAIAPGALGMLVPLATAAVVEGAEIVDSDTIRAGGLSAHVRAAANGSAACLVIRTADAETVLEWIDEGDSGDEYDFGAIRGDAPIVARIDRWTTRMGGPGVAELEVVHVIDLPAGLTADRSARARATVRHEILTRVRVSASSPLAQLVTTFDNAADDHRLRLRASIEGSVSEITALGHFDEVPRPVRPTAPEVPWKQDPPGLDHCLGAVRLEADTPVLLVGRGVHEYEARHIEHVTAVELTGLRSVGWLSRDDIAGRPGHAGPGLATPDAQCRGPHRLELAVGVGETATFDAARAFLAPPMVFEAFGVEALQESGALARARDIGEDTPAGALERMRAVGLEITGDDVVVSTCKLADDGSGDLVIRWWAPRTATRPRARIRVAAPVASVVRTRLDESPLGPAPLVDGLIEIGMRPGGISTVRIALA